VSLCLNHYAESGGYLIIGGIDSELYDDPIIWLNFKQVNSLSVDASSIYISSTLVTSKITVDFDTKTPYIMMS
jgi:hypothetical protein